MKRQANSSPSISPESSMQQQQRSKDAITDTEETSVSPSNPDGVILEQDRFLPIANVARVMKRALPATGKLSKEAKELLQECVTEFILFITSESSERCSMEKRKTITGDDLLVAFTTLGFDEYLEPLGEYLRKYREANKQLYTLKGDEFSSSTELSERFDSPSTSTVVGTSKLDTYSAVTIATHSSPSKAKHHSQSIAKKSARHGVPTSTATTSAIESTSTTTSFHSPVQMPTQLQQVPMWYDNSGQYYITVNGPDGVPSLLPVNLTTTGVLPEGISILPAQPHTEDREEQRDVSDNSSNTYTDVSYPQRQKRSRNLREL